MRFLKLPNYPDFSLTGSVSISTGLDNLRSTVFMKLTLPKINSKLIIKDNSKNKEQNKELIAN